MQNTNTDLDATTATLWLKFREEYRTSPNEEWEWEELGTFDCLSSAEAHANDRGHEILDSRSWCSRLTWFVEEHVPESILKEKIEKAQSRIEYETERISRYKAMLMGF